MAGRSAVLMTASVVALFVAIVAAILLLLAAKAITFPMARLMLIVLLGMYLGFGFLLAVYRFVSRLR